MQGALEEMLGLCSAVQDGNTTTQMTPSLVTEFNTMGENMNKEGLRVLGLATRVFSNGKEGMEYSQEDENHMLFQGFLAFLDPPKESAGHAIRGLEARGVAIKVWDPSSCYACCTSLISLTDTFSHLFMSLFCSLIPDLPSQS